MTIGRATPDPIPLLVVAGSWGAGKTTVIAHCLADPAFARSAVLCNEAGATAIDVQLLAGGTAVLRTLEGCACCVARDRLPVALGETLSSRGRLPIAIERVFLELAPTADLPRVLEALAGDESIAERFALHGVLGVIDATRGLAALEDALERQRVEAADALLVVKAEEARADELAALRRALARANPQARILEMEEFEANPRSAWDAVDGAPGRELRRIEAAMAAVGDPAPDHAARVVAIDVARPVELSGFCMRLAVFLDAHRGRVVRVKGLIPIEGRQGPGVIQAVGDRLHPVRTLREWPDPSARGVLVVAGEDFEEAAVRGAVLGKAPR